MHGPLDEHLHTEECNVIIRELQRCHQENSMFKQFFGACNQLDWAMRACTKKERLEREKEARQEAAERVSRVRNKMANLKSDDWRENMKARMDQENAEK